ncbi:nesprin-3 isoform X2 [Spea bombifrons]|uniref:nesprin-3 isoform X2 n=1 Tax=Spea bombifrons TaxID=233779 RepID=UPI0023499C7D|nr:nesprin-3 isoform X2 [Spea bombifrons]
MIQSLQDEFETSVENAEAWMKAVHKCLEDNDNTHGPRAALESRLRETEKICSREPEGRLLLDMVLVKAEALLNNESSQKDKYETHVKLGTIKSMFEETMMYMTHCHSRIEWVWLHWNEYLKAQDDFTVWIHNMTLTLEPDMELQLGLKEKRWQLEQSEVLLKDVNNQSRLLNHLLEEAASLYNRLGDPSVDESVQNGMIADYKKIKKKAQERTALLETITKEHEAYAQDIDHFRLWLNEVIEKLKRCVGGPSESKEDTLRVLQEISQDVKSGEKRLEVLEVKSAKVIKNTSPLGAEELCKELEELRRALAELKLMNDDEEENLVKSLNSESAFLILSKQLEANVTEFKKTVQRLEGNLESEERGGGHEGLISRWRTLNVTQSALGAEEPKAEQIRVQLKDLFKFSKDVQPLSDTVIGVTRDYQRAKNKAFRLCTETESELRQLFQNPLREFQLWKPITERVLNSTLDSRLTSDGLLQIETLLEESASLKDKLSELERKKDHIISVLGEEKADSLLEEAATAEKERASLHEDLLERTNSLQKAASRSKEFDVAFKLLQKRLSAIRVKTAKEKALQPDVVGKEARLQRLQMLHEELINLQPQMEELFSMAESNPTRTNNMRMISSEYVFMQNILETEIAKSNECLNDHYMLNYKIAEIQPKMALARQELESYRDDSRGEVVTIQEEYVEVLMSQLALMEVEHQEILALGEQVMLSTAREGRSHIQVELDELSASFSSLKALLDTMPRKAHEGYPWMGTTQLGDDSTELVTMPGFGGNENVGRKANEGYQWMGTAQPGDDFTELVTLPGFGGHENVGRKANEEYPPNRTEQSGDHAAKLVTIQGYTDNENAGRFPSVDSEGFVSKGPVPLENHAAQSKQEFGETESSGRILHENDLKRTAASGKTPTMKTHTSSIAEKITQPTPNVLSQRKKRKNQKMSALSESVDFVDSPLVPKEGNGKTGDEHALLLKKFKNWLKSENSKLSSISSSKEDMKIRQSKLQKLQSRVPQGQSLFESLLLFKSSMNAPEAIRLEDLRYDWMLYKSKLRDYKLIRNPSNLKISEEPKGITKKSDGFCSFLHRVCRMALPLQLLLLLLLFLVVFLLPFMQRTQNCALSNNFARSFSVMLKYEGPPPT